VFEVVDDWLVTAIVPTVIPTPLAAAVAVNDAAKPVAEVSVKKVERVVLVEDVTDTVGKTISKVTETPRLMNDLITTELLSTPIFVATVT